MTDNYQHYFIDDIDCTKQLGKIVCVGRNYADHAKELNNPIPKQPLLFIKPASAAVALDQPIVIPSHQGECHHELEMAILITAPLSKASAEQATAAIGGLGLALDLTLRDLQSSLKQKGHPWERAKAFDGSCPLSAFISASKIDIQDLKLTLSNNGQLCQSGNTADMIFSVNDLLIDISNSFSLMPGDVVLTGTPAGVGPLQSGDELTATLAELLTVSTRVI
ncbi:MAG: 2-keto-4-pentenoate hydratase/2-oxohepta-3-ene-1,7-dioic acid hydratase in catechol pathway [Oceanicoccus sp.]|jgi:2-keto-4-pentenoate hydratase/2-oxohepta-3-ene-1,7-dioic acid hydratase in catechol pathway